MKTHYSLFLLFLMFICAGQLVLAQQITVSREELIQNQWTDGYEFVKYLSSEETEVMGVPNPTIGHPERLFFIGGSLHEGGTNFCLEKKDGIFQIADLGENIYQWFPAGCRLSGITDCLIFRNGKNGSLQGVLQKISPDGNLEKHIRRDLLTFGLAGTYNDSLGRTYTFSSEECRADGFSSPQYDFGYVFETPSLVLKFKGITYIVKKQSQKLTLQPAEEGEYGYLPLEDESPLVLHCVRDSSEYDYPLTSEQVLTASEIRLYSGACTYPCDTLNVLDALSTMRNEIFARHGYGFTHPYWQKHFSKKTWYHPVTSSAEGLLSDIEKVNVEHIRKIEREIKEGVGY